MVNITKEIRSKKFISDEYVVRKIPNKDSYPFLLNIHYAKRIPSISYTYGLFKKGELVGVVCYGTPASHPLRIGIAGANNIHNILELNRLCLKYNIKNEASFLVSKSLKLLPQGRIIISFADTAQSHKGIVYQACNFSYHGLSAKRTDWCLKSKPHLHGQSIADLSRGHKDRAKYMRDTYGDDFFLKPRPRKHRYIYITGNKRLRKQLRKQLKYKEESYPK